MRSKASGPDQGGRGTVSPRQPSYTFCIIPNEVGVTALNARVSDYRDSTSASPFNLPWQRLASTTVREVPFSPSANVFPFFFASYIADRSAFIFHEHKERTDLYIVPLQE